MNFVNNHLVFYIYISCTYIILTPFPFVAAHMTSISATKSNQPMRIEDEIKQSTFKDSLQKTQVNLLFTASWVSQLTNEALKYHGLTPQQFNILRILRGQYPKPASVKLLTARMIDKMSNASRLVDKLRDKNYVKRKVCASDRRKVDIVITQLGLDTLQHAIQDLEARMSTAMNLTEEEFVQLNDLLDKLRASGDADPGSV